MIDRDIASWLTTYRNLHTTPELSHREEKTSAFVAGELRKLGFTVTERIGKVSKRAVDRLRHRGVLKNGPWTNSARQNRARCAARRRENQAFPYSSNVKTKNDAGLEVECDACVLGTTYT
jgi:hippurate hydrolase